MNTLYKNFLTLGCLQTLGMALYHFFIPFQFQWGQYLSKGIPTINWSLYGLNNYFSFNLLVISAFLLYHLKFKVEKLHTIKTLAFISLLFWVFSATYQIIEPMPLPSSLQWLGVNLPSIAILNILIFSVPLIKLTLYQQDISSH